VIVSKNEKFPNGCKIFAQCGWRTHTIIKPEDYIGDQLYRLPDFGEIPYSYGLSVLGMPGEIINYSV
jgi:prostaglandin reductase 1